MLEHKGGQRPEKPERDTTQLEARILTTGVQLQAGGIEWWHAIQMIDTLKEKELIKSRQRGQVYSSLAALQKDGLVRAKWVEEERHKRYYQVTEDGKKERSRVPVISDVDNTVPGFIPAPEAI